MNSTMRVDVRTGDMAYICSEHNEPCVAATRHGHCVLVKCDRYITDKRVVAWTSKQYELTAECIERIADAVVKKLKEAQRYGR